MANPFKKLLSIFRPKAAAEQGSKALTPMSPELIKFFGQATASGKSVSDESSMRVAAVWACRRILSECIGMISRSMYRRLDEQNSERASDHWLHDVLVHSPNMDMTGVEFFEAQVMNLTGNGNAYSLIDRLGSRISALYPMLSTDVRPMRKLGNNTPLKIQEGHTFYRYNDRGAPQDFPREKIWHVKGFGSNGMVGLAPIGAAREAVGGAMAAEEFGNRFFSQGGMPAGTVSYPGWLDDEQRAIARETLQNLIGGLGKAHQFALFEGGVKPEPWNSMNMEDMQFILTRKFSVLEICRIFRVPPHMVAELEKGASYASIEQMSMDFVMFTLMPYFTRIEASVQRWLLSPQERDKFFFRFNFETLLRADSKSRAEFEAIMVTNGIMTRNEVRAKENLNKAPDKNMDAFTVQLAMSPIEKLGEKPPAAPAAPGFPPRKREEEEPPAKQNISVAVASPADQHAAVLAHVAQLTEATQSLAHGMVQLSKALVDKVERSAAENADLFAQQVIALGKQQEQAIHRIVEGIKESDTKLGAALESVGSGLDKLARRSATVTVGGETFTIESKKE